MVDRSRPEPPLALRHKVMLGTVGAACLLFTLLGLLGNIMGHLAITPSARTTDAERSAIYVLVMVSTGFYAALGVVGVQLLRTRVDALRPLVVVLMLEMVYAFGLLGLSMWGFAAHDPWWASVLLGASVANMSMHAQGTTFFWLWGPLLVAWGRRGTGSRAPGRTTVLAT